ncbi:MAG: T9SS type A sorting domain-containing protein [Fibromonadales bacterium]|nr:T9SS type A sorting domain-containing protein [Fibromonadales bacterium]
MKQFKLFAILLMAIFASAAFATDISTRIDRLDKGSLKGISGVDNWYNWASATIGNPITGGNDINVLCTGDEKCAELRGIRGSSGEAQLGFSFKGNKSLDNKYELSKCNSFKFKYKSNVPFKFNLQVMGTSFIGTGPDYNSNHRPIDDQEWKYLRHYCKEFEPSDNINEWTTVTVNPAEYTRCAGGSDAGGWANGNSSEYLNTTSNASRRSAVDSIMHFKWVVNPSGGPAGNLKVTEVECISNNLFFMEPTQDVSGKYGQKLSELDLSAWEGTGLSWADENIVLAGTIGAGHGSDGIGTLEWDTQGSGVHNIAYFKDVNATYRVGENSVNGVVTVWVDPAEAADFAPTGLTATYGQTLAQVTPALSAGWTWIKATSTSVGNAGQQTFYAKYDGKQHPLIKATPGSAGIPVTITVNKADPIVPTNVEAVYGQTLAQIKNQLTTASGSWTWVDDGATSVGDATNVGVELGKKFKANFAGTTNYNAASNVDVLVFVDKAPGVFGTPAINKTYETTLTLASLNLATELGKSGYTWKEGVNTAALLNAGNNQKFNAIYTDPSGNYYPANGQITVNVAKKAGTFGAPSAKSATYTESLKLAGVTLDAGYAWNAPTTALNAGDGQTFAATYTDPSGNYESANGNITVNVAKANTAFVSISALSTTYTSTLKLSGVELPSAVYAWKVPDTALNAGDSQTFTAIYTKNTNYNPVEGFVTVNVAKAAGTFTPTTISTTYETGLTLAKLTLADGYVWYTEPTTALDAGNGQTFVATYTNPNGNYTSAKGNITVNVAKASGLVATERTINVSSTNTSVKTFDLRNIVLNKADAGTVTYTDLNYTDHGNVLTREPTISENILSYQGNGNTSGTTTITIDITSQNYVDATVQIHFVAIPKTEVVIAGLTKKDYVYDGSSKSGVTGTATSGEYVGDLEYTYAGTGIVGTTTTQPTKAGEYYLTVSVPSDADYIGSETYTFSIAKAAGTFGSPAALSATYVTTLKLSSLILPLNYAWIASNTALNAGNGQTFAATYDDPSGNYTTATGTITVNVAKAAGTFGTPTAISTTYEKGLTLAKLSLGTGYAWVTPATVLNAGNAQSIPATYTDPSGNYTTTTGAITVNVAKASAPVLTSLTARDIYDEMPLTASKLSRDPNGTWAWDASCSSAPTAKREGDGTLPPDIKTCKAVFTPNDAANYNWALPIGQTVSIKVLSLKQQVLDVATDIKEIVVDNSSIPFTKSGTGANEKYVATLASIGVANNKTALDAYAASFAANLLTLLDDSVKHSVTITVAVESDGSQYKSVYTAPSTGVAGNYTFYVKVQRNPVEFVGPFVVTIPALPAVVTPPSGGGGGDNGCLSYPCTSTPPKVTPILPPKVAISNISVSVTAGAIVLEKLQSNAKVEVFNMQGKRIYSSNAINSEVLRIQAQAGAYAVRVSVGSETKTMRVSMK